VQPGTELVEQLKLCRAKGRWFVSSPWKPTIAEAKIICASVIERAMKDLKHPPAQLGIYRTEDQRKTAEAKLREVERDRASARAFFFSDDSNFPWICEGLGGSVKTIREALRKRLRGAPTESMGARAR
jgi:hypothetical protein